MAALKNVALYRPKSEDDDNIMEVNFNLMHEDDSDNDILPENEGTSATVCDINADNAETEMSVDLEGINFDEEIEAEEAANISIGLETPLQDPGSANGCDDGKSGFDYFTGKLWIYPTNYSVRDYQYNIVQQALYKNTLVVLPTGLGKTFIAAVVMYNLYRWYPQGKIIFMAPTKPLVAQQIQACYSIMGIPKSDTVEMTGTMPPVVRQKAWREKRVVFLTPQVMTNDLSRGSCIADNIKCLVVDEAHKALGNHAYCQVVRELIKFTREFRVLALSATPGGDLKAVQQVVNNLLISHIELRSEESIDIHPYTHERKVEKVVVPMGEELMGVRTQYIQIMTCVIQRLIKNRVLYKREATKLSKFLILKARDEFRQNPPQNLQQVQFGNIEADFALAMSIYHGFELLQLHGLRSLYNFLMGIISGEKGYGRTRSELLRNADFNTIMESLRQKFSGCEILGTSMSGDSKLIAGHPKMLRLEEIVVEHFQSFQKRDEETRVMIFSQYRDSVQEIAAILNQHQPLVKVMPFIGQSSAGKSAKGYTQKEQLMVMRQFREGGYNTLVSTCVGEEGLDIGDVDLIVCFDAHKSPIRLVQRMGRTGRKRRGRIVMLVTEGKEEQIYNQSLYSKKSIHKAILNGAKYLHFYPSNPRMVPASVTPQCHKMFITIAPNIKKSQKAPTPKAAAGGNKSRKSIADISLKQVKRPRQGGCLTPAQYEEIRQEFAEVAPLAKHLPRPRCMVLSAHSAESQTSSTAEPNLINLAEWMPWQNRLQSTHIIGHSIQSVHLVKDAEFIEILQCVGEEEDNYSNEMRKYFNKNSVGLKRGDSGHHRPGQSTLTHFLTLSQKSLCKDAAPEAQEKSHSMKSVTKRKWKGLAKSRTTSEGMEAANTGSVVVSSESESSIGEILEESNDKAAVESKPKVSKLFTALKDSNSSSSVHEKFINQKGRVKKREVTEHERDSTRTNTKHSATLRAKPERKAKRVTFRRKGSPVVRKEKKRKSIFQILDSNLVKSHDNGDFVNDDPVSKDKAVEECVHDNVVTERCEKKNIFNCCTDGKHREDTLRSSHAESEHHCGLDEEVSCTQNITNTGGALKGNLAEVKVSSVKPSEERVIHVLTPPPVSEVEALCSSVKSPSEFASLDLEELTAQRNKADIQAHQAEVLSFQKLSAGKGSSFSSTPVLKYNLLDTSNKAQRLTRQDISNDDIMVIKHSLGAHSADQILHCVSPAGEKAFFSIRNPHLTNTGNKSVSRDMHEVPPFKSELLSPPKSPLFPNLPSKSNSSQKGRQARKSLSFDKTPPSSAIAGNDNLEKDGTRQPQCNNWDKSYTKLLYGLSSHHNHVDHKARLEGMDLTNMSDFFNSRFEDDLEIVETCSFSVKPAASVKKDTNSVTPTATVKEDTSFTSGTKPAALVNEDTSFTQIVKPAATVKMNTSFSNCVTLTATVKEDTSFTKSVKPAATVKIDTSFGNCVTPTAAVKDISFTNSHANKNKCNESLITFTQVLELLQASSSENSPEVIDISTPEISPVGEKLVSTWEQYIKQNVSCKITCAEKQVYSCDKKEGINQQAEEGFGVNVLGAEKSSVSVVNRDFEPQCNTLSHNDFVKVSPAKSFSKSTNSDDRELPQFDLGFDLDDDDVIPPTPVKDASQVSAFSVKCHPAGRTLSFDSVTLTSDSSKPTGQKERSPASSGRRSVEDKDSSPKWDDKSAWSEVMKENVQGHIGSQYGQAKIPQVVSSKHIPQKLDEDAGHRKISVSPGKLHDDLWWPESDLCEPFTMDHFNDQAPNVQDNNKSKVQSNNIKTTRTVTTEPNIQVSPPTKVVEDDALTMPFDDATFHSSPKILDLPFTGYVPSAVIVTDETKSTVTVTEISSNSTSDYKDNFRSTSLKSNPSKLQLGKQKQQLPVADERFRNESSRVSNFTCECSTVGVKGEKYSFLEASRKPCNSLCIQKSSMPTDVAAFICAENARNQASPDLNGSAARGSKRDNVSAGNTSNGSLPAEDLNASKGGTSTSVEKSRDEDASADQDLKRRKIASPWTGMSKDVSASTPIRPICERNSAVDPIVIIDDETMESLTPIKGFHQRHLEKDEDDLEDSFIIRRWRKPVINSDTFASDTSLLKTTTNPVKKQHNISSVEEKSKSTSFEEKHFSMLDTSDNDTDDFEDGVSFVKNCKPVLRKKDKKRKLAKAAGFIEREAEVSENDEASSDEAEVMDDYYECSFVDDNTEMTQTQSTDMRAVYLKSVRSPQVGGLAGHFKLHYNNRHHHRSDIYSQAVPEDQGMSEYEKDSFCVDSGEEISYEDDKSPFLEHRKKKRRIPSKGKQPRKGPGKRLIKILAETSSDEERILPMTQEFSTSSHRAGRRVILSSSEDEGAREKNGSFATHSMPEGQQSVSPRHLVSSLDDQNMASSSTADENPSKSIIITNQRNITCNQVDVRSKHVQPETTEIVNFDLHDNDWFDDDFVVHTKPSEGSSVISEPAKPTGTLLSLKSKKSTSNVGTMEVRDAHLDNTSNPSTSYSKDTKNHLAAWERPTQKNAESMQPAAAQLSWSDVNLAAKVGSSESHTGSTNLSITELKSGKDTSSGFQKNSSPTNLSTSSSSTSCFNENILPSHMDMLQNQCLKSPVLSSGRERNEVWPSQGRILSNTQSGPQVMSRAERLQKQKEKQERFRQRLQQMQNSASLSKLTVSTGADMFQPDLETSAWSNDTKITVSITGAELETSALSNNTNNVLRVGHNKSCVPCLDGAPSSVATAQISPVFTKKVEGSGLDGQLQILVDSREISGAQDIISALRLKHRIKVTAQQLTACDYILSNHLAADRIHWSALNNSTLCSKLASRLCAMQALYDRCVLIVETDKVKPGQEKGKKKKSLHHTKYLAYIAQSRIKMYFTDSAEETAALLSNLCHVEGRKERALTVPTSLSSRKAEMLKFLMAVPKVTFPQALNLIHRFHSIAELIASPPSVIEEHGCMSRASAQLVHKFLRHPFDLQMMPLAPKR